MRIGGNGSRRGSPAGNKHWTTGRLWAAIVPVMIGTLACVPMRVSCCDLVPGCGYIRRAQRKSAEKRRVREAAQARAAVMPWVEANGPLTLADPIGGTEWTVRAEDLSKFHGDLHFDEGHEFRVVYAYAEVARDDIHPDWDAEWTLGIRFAFAQRDGAPVLVSHWLQSVKPKSAKGWPRRATDREVYACLQGGQHSAASTPESCPVHDRPMQPMFLCGESDLTVTHDSAGCFRGNARRKADEPAPSPLTAGTPIFIEAKAREVVEQWLLDNSARPEDPRVRRRLVTIADPLADHHWQVAAGSVKLERVTAAEFPATAVFSIKTIDPGGKIRLFLGATIFDKGDGLAVESMQLLAVESPAMASRLEGKHVPQARSDLTRARFACPRDATQHFRTPTAMPCPLHGVQTVPLHECDGVPVVGDAPCAGQDIDLSQLSAPNHE